MTNGNKITGTFNSNTSVEFYRRCAITDLFIGNQTANQITGFKIGTTPNGGEIYTAPSPLLGGSFVKDNNPPDLFNFFNDTTIYISATNWNGSSIGLVIKFEDLT